MRFCSLLIALLVALPASAQTAFPTGKLGGTVRPLAYRLELEILPDQTTFSGTTEIDIQVDAPTPLIHLHGNGLVVASATYTGAVGTRLAGTTQAGRYQQLDPTGVAAIDFAAPVPAGRGTLRIQYSAPLDKVGEGLYRTTVAGESYAFTQFEPIDARRMFPGFDEPGYKTPFDIAVTTRPANVVIGNTPIRSEQPAGAGLKRVEFMTTLPLPTYLIALAVGPLDVVDGPAIPPNAIRDRPLLLRGIATRGKGPKLKYALDNTAAIIDYLEAYFDTPFPYPKLDLIASPEAGGGMENAGAIIYGDSRLLLDDHPSPQERRGFGGIHAHELAHQWFGDLVTPRWWDDIWLNEAFASWMSFKAGDAWNPDLGFDVVPALQTPAAMTIDSRIAARQIRQPVTRNQDIGSAFDGITYLKGAAVLGMFESYLGEDRFRAGIRAHMRRFPYAVANVEDFMASLAQGSGRADIVPGFRSFIDQPGVPLVTTKPECGPDGVSLRLAQSRYLPIGSRGDPARSWQLPLCLRYGDTAGGGKLCTLLTESTTSIPLQSAGCPTFVMPNANGAGYYRFGFDDDGWRALMTHFDQLGEAEALAVADSLSAAYQANRLSTGSLVEAMRIMARSPYPEVVLAPDSDLIRLRDYLAPENADAVRALMRSLYRPRLDALEKDGPATTPEQAIFQTNLIRFLALEARDPELRSSLAAKARRYIRMGKTNANPETALDTSAVSPALVDVALQVGVQEYGAPFAETLIDRMLASNDSQFRGQAATGLSATDDPGVGERVRKLLLDPRLRGREPTAIAFGLAARPSQRRATFNWFKANDETFTARVSHFGHRWFPTVGAGFCTRAERDELEGFFTPIVSHLDGADRTLAETLEGIELCTALVTVKHAEAAAAFQATDAAIR
ncbi:MAG: ERAP1-like C-terminal domain-containing protein [Chromatiales bacterium]|nr:ERAP1-like C-terminal domain-containing protein [Chromatiales bacterium]